MNLVGEILWQVASQTRAFRWFNEDREEVVLVCGEARAVLRADAADFHFNVSWRSRGMRVFGTYQGAPTIMRSKNVDNKE
jgi:hypothetical protein